LGLLDLFFNESQKKVLGPLSLAGLLVAFLALIFIVPLEGEMLGGRFCVDAVAWWFKILFLLAGFLTVILSIDMLDGRVARMSHTTSSFGGQLDSLCDMISFGVAPAFLVLKVLSLNNNDEG